MDSSFLYKTEYEYFDIHIFLNLNIEIQQRTYYGL